MRCPLFRDVGHADQYNTNQSGKALGAPDSTATADLSGTGVIGPQSPRSIKRKMTLIVIAGVLALVGIVAGTYYFSMRPVFLRIAVGPANSDDVKVVLAMAQAFTRDNRQVRLRPVLTEGAVASAAALETGKVDLAIVRGDIGVPAIAQAVATLRKNVAVVWVPRQRPSGKKAAPKITTISQLSGQRVGVIGKSLANVNLLNVILRQYGVDPAKVTITQLSTNEIGEAARLAKVDAFLAAGPATSKITAEAVSATSKDGAPTFLPIESADAISQNHPAYEAAEIPAGTFGGQPARPGEDIKTISFAHHLVARKGASEATIAALTRQIFTVRQAVMNDLPQAAKIETPDTDKDAVIPVHPGAAAYVDGEEKTFFERYSDFIWWALMGASAFGSIGAWFASYLRKDDRTNNSTLRGRLLDMLALARKSSSTEELDAMQTEADAIMRDTLNCFEEGAIEEGSLTAFHIALEQFHNAVADRKALLGSQPAAPARPSVALVSGG